MKIILSILVIGFALVSLVTIQCPDRIKNKVLRLVLILSGALAGFTVAGRSLYELSDGFRKPLGDYWGINLLVPLGWFMGACFIILYAFARMKSDQARTHGSG